MGTDLFTDTCLSPTPRYCPMEKPSNREELFARMDNDARKKLREENEEFLSIYSLLRGCPGMGLTELSKTTKISRKHLSKVLMQMTREGLIKEYVDGRRKRYQVCGDKGGRLCAGCPIWRMMGSTFTEEVEGHAQMTLSWPDFIFRQIRQKVEEQGVSVDVWIVRTLMKELTENMPVT